MNILLFKNNLLCVYHLQTCKVLVDTLELVLVHMALNNLVRLLAWSLLGIVAPAQAAAVEHKPKNDDNNEDDGQEKNQPMSEDCCGCPQKPTEQVRELMKTLQRLTTDSKLEAALQLTLPSATATVIEPGLVIPTVTCCQKEQPISAVLEGWIQAADWSNFWDLEHHVRELASGAVLVTSVGVKSGGGSGSRAYRMEWKWIPTEGCNFKLAHLREQEFACPANGSQYPQCFVCSII